MTTLSGLALEIPRKEHLPPTEIMPVGAQRLSQLDRPAPLVTPLAAGIAAGITGGLSTMAISHLIEPHLAGTAMIQRGIIGGLVFGVVAYLAQSRLAGEGRTSRGILG